MNVSDLTVRFYETESGLGTNKVETYFGSHVFCSGEFDSGAGNVLRDLARDVAASLPRRGSTMNAS